MIIWDLLTSSPITAPRPFVPLFALPLVPTIVDVFTLLFTEFPFKFVAALTWLFGMVAAVADAAAATAVPAALTFVCFKLSKNKIYRINRMNIIYRIIRKKKEWMWNTIIFRSKIVNQIISSVDEYEYIKHLKRFGSKTKTVWSSRFVSLYMRDPFNCHMEFHRSYVQMDISVNDRGKQFLLNSNFNHTLSVRCLPFSNQWHFYTRKKKY